MSQQSNNQSDNQSDSEETSYLKEAVRLSELLITEQSSVFVTIERKAVFLVTLCIAIIAYLLSWAIGSDNQVTTIISFRAFITFLVFINIFVLIRAAWIGVSALLARSFGGPGTDPEYPMQEYFNHNFNKMAKDLLKYYAIIFAGNNKTLDEKSRCLESSLQWGKAGIILTCIWVTLAFYCKLSIIP